MIEFWVVTCTLGLKSGTKPGVAGTTMGKKVLGNTLTLSMGAFGASQMHPCPYQWSVQGFDARKLQLISGVTLVSGWDGSGSSIGEVEGLCGVFPSIPLKVTWEV